MKKSAFFNKNERIIKHYSPIYWNIAIITAGQMDVYIVSRTLLFGFNEKSSNERESAKENRRHTNDVRLILTVRPIKTNNARRVSPALQDRSNGAVWRYYRTELKRESSDRESGSDREHFFSSSFHLLFIIPATMQVALHVASIEMSFLEKCSSSFLSIR